MILLIKYTGHGTNDSAHRYNLTHEKNRLSVYGHIKKRRKKMSHV